MTMERRITDVERDVAVKGAELAGLRADIASLRAETEGRFNRADERRTELYAATNARLDKIEATQSRLTWSVIGVVLTVSGAALTLALTLGSGGGG